LLDVDLITASFWIAIGWCWPDYGCVLEWHRLLPCAAGPGAIEVTYHKSNSKISSNTVCFFDGPRWLCCIIHSR